MSRSRSRSGRRSGLGFAVAGRPARGIFARAAGLAAAALAGFVLAGCGLGPGEGTGDASLLVTRDYGTEVLVDEPEMAVNESSNAMRLLDETADLETTYGGEYVQSVDGLSGGNDGGRSFDWFFSVNGIVAERGSAQFPIAGGDTVWWDFRDWTDAMEVGAVVGQYPAPFLEGYDDRDWGVEVECHGDRTACGMVEGQLREAGVDLEDTGKNMRLVVGTWDELLDTPEGRRLDSGPSASGVFASFETSTVEGGSGPPPSRGDGKTTSLVGLDVRGEAGHVYEGDAGLVAAMRRGEDPPVWLVTGTTDRGVRLAAAALTPEDLERRYAAVVHDGRVGSLPVL